MEQVLNSDIAALQRMSTSDLRRRYAEVFGDQPPSGDRVWMLKRLAWRLQALAEGGLSGRARRPRSALEPTQGEDRVQTIGEGRLCSDVFHRQCGTTRQGLWRFCGSGKEHSRRIAQRSPLDAGP